MRFEFRPLLTVFTVLGVIVLLALGTWQARRLAWKMELIETVEARTEQAPLPVSAVFSRLEEGEEIAYLPVRATGGFVTDRTAHVFGTWDGQAGWYVFQPFRLDENGRIVFVNRGFVPAEERAASYPLPDAEALLGLARPFSETAGLAALLRPQNDPTAGLFYDRSFETLSGAFPGVDTAEVAPFVIDSTLPTAKPLGGTTRLDFSNRHLGYAITWYGLAAGLLLVFALMSRAPRA
jgi:surfeit locus 1 family protein